MRGRIHRWQIHSRRTGVRGGTGCRSLTSSLPGESSTTMAARLGPLSPSSPPFFLPPFAMARQGVPETDSKSLEKNRSLGLSFAVGCANRALTPRRTRASPSEMAMSVVQAAVAPARLTVPPRARTRALPARTRALPARRARVAPRASADGAAEEVAKEVKEALDGSSLFLVGMMGTGKSSVGKKLAASLGYSFFDTCVPRGAPRAPALSKNTSRTVERHRPSRPSVRRASLTPHPPPDTRPAATRSSSRSPRQPSRRSSPSPARTASGRSKLRCSPRSPRTKSASSRRAAASSRRRPTGCTCATASCSV